MKSKTQPSPFTKILDSIVSGRHRRGEVLRAFTLLTACAVAPRVQDDSHPHGSISVREEEYMAEIVRWSADEARLFGEAFHGLVEAMEARPFTDLLGPLHQEWRADIDRKSGGEFYTPDHVCRLMAGMSIPETLPQDRPLEVMEPAAGCGGMIPATAQQLAEVRGISPLCMRATCVDVDRTACDICYINLTLNGIPATVVHGNSLSLKTWGAWRNLMWPLARPRHPFEGVGAKDVSEFAGGIARIVEILRDLEKPVAAPEPVETITLPNGQMTFSMFGEEEATCQTSS